MALAEESQAEFAIRTTGQVGKGTDGAIRPVHRRSRRPTRTEHLESLLESLRREEHGEVSIEWRPFRGWWLTGEKRDFTDEGDYLGANWREAERYLKWFLR